MKPTIHNLFTDDPGTSAEERIHLLLEDRKLRIERIVSNGQASPPGFWYEQEESEWVVLLRGNAVLEFEHGDYFHLSAGDYLLIERHVKHRVGETSADALWLAVHY